MKNWPEHTLGELDHRKLKPPYIRLNSYKVGSHGDTIYLYDIRLTKPNEAYLSTAVLHSFEHLLLAGFRRYMEANFINVAPMGCQTGFYLVLVNEARPNVLCDCYEKILNDVINAHAIPYADIQQCGQAQHHDLNGAKQLAHALLACKAKWLEVI